MQGHYAPYGHKPDILAQVTIAPELVDWLRRATYAEIGTAAESLDAAVTAGDREEHREQFRAPMQSLRESYALLDALGWAKAEQPTPVELDLNENSWALMRILRGAQEFADEEVYEVSLDTNGALMASDCKRFMGLMDLTDEVRGRIDTLAVIDEALTVPDLVA